MSPKQTRPNEDDDIASTARLARAVIYLRVSTKDQAERGGEGEGFSIPAQREACKRKASALGAVVVDEFVDRGESAKTADRPELQRMLRSIAAEPVQYVIVHKVDRLARNRVDDVQINVELRATGATLVSCTENIDETPSGALMHGIMSSIAEFYSRNLANEVIKGSTQKAKAGGTNGKAPTGYLNVRKYDNGIENRTVEIDPVRGPLMTWAFEEYSTGKWSVKRLLAEVTERGLDTTSSPNSPSKPLVKSHFHRLLRNSYYKGIVSYRGVDYPGRHQPLVTEDVWDRVQAVLTSQMNSGEKVRDHPHYLKGSVFCGQCGSRLGITHAKGRRGTVYPYFVCIGRHQKRTDCKQRAMLIDLVEALVEDHYKSLQPFDELVDEIRSTLLEQIEGHHRQSEHVHATNQRRLVRLNSERAKLLDGYYAGAISVELLRTEQTRITSATEAIDRQTKAYDLDANRVRVNLEAALDLAADWHSAYLKATEPERRQMNQGIFEKIYVRDDDDMDHEFAEPFNILLGKDVERVATRRYLASKLSSDEVNEAWAKLAQQWQIHEEPMLVGAETRNPHGNECRGGLKDVLLVDLMGRLSNPPEAVAIIADQGRSERQRPRRAGQAAPAPAGTRRRVGPQEETGRLSNPVQRRLSRTEIEQLSGQYRHGSSIDTLSRRYEIHRTTVMHHLNQSDVARRTVTRKMNDETVALAAAQYEQGASLAVVASAFRVHERTLARELRRAGVATRPRRGWRP